MRTRWWWSSLCAAAALVGTGAGLATAAGARDANSGATTAATAPRVGAIALQTIELNELPPEAHETLALIKRGGPFPFRKDGSTFGNRERRLPLQARGHYAEYTVRTPGSRDRGPRRIIAARGATGNFATSGEYYYTDDHYETFRRIRER